MRHAENLPPSPEAALRAHYAKTALSRMGIPFERGIQIVAVKKALEGAIRAEAKRSGAGEDGRAGA